MDSVITKRTGDLEFPPAEDVDEGDRQAVPWDGAAECDESLRAGESGDFLDGAHGHHRGRGDPSKLAEEVPLEDALAVVGYIEEEPSAGGCQQVEGMVPQELHREETPLVVDATNRGVDFLLSDGGA
jgi:hypothetical protein